MNGKHLVIIGFILLIYVCFRRQRRHFVEICANSPSKSIKAAFQMSAATLAVAISIPRENLDLHTLVSVAVLFCAKVIFSSTIVGITLSGCMFDYILFDHFSFYTVYNSLVSIAFWNLSEDVREVLTRISFIWLMASPFVNKTIDFIFHSVL